MGKQCKQWQTLFWGGSKITADGDCSHEIKRRLLKLMSIELVVPFNHSSSVTSFSSFLQSFPASMSFPMSQFFTSGVQNIGVSTSASSFQWIFRLIFFRIDWFDLPAVQGTLKSLLWHHCSKASIFQCSAFFMVQLSHPYMTTGKAIVLTIYEPLSAK